MSGDRTAIQYVIAPDRKFGEHTRNWCAQFEIAVPTSRPIPAVTAMAKAPQKRTRATGLRGRDPPAAAPTHPSRARNRSDATASPGTSRSCGSIAAASTGSRAPNVKVSAEVNAAVIGRAEVISVI